MASTLSQLYRKDQDNTAAATAVVFRNSSAATRLATSFTPSFTKLCYGIDWKFGANAGTPTGNIWIELRAPGTTPETGELLSTTSMMSVADITADVFSFTFPTPVTLVGGQVYWLVLNADFAINASSYMTFFSNTGVYARGNNSVFDGSSWTAGTLDYGFVTFTDFKKWSICQVNGNNSNDGKGWLKAAFTSGGTYVPQIGDVITGNSSGRTATIQEIVVSSGTFADGDAAGSIYILNNATGAFTAGESLNIDANTDVMTLTADFVFSCFKDVAGCTTAKGVVGGDIQEIAKSPDPYNTGVNATVTNQSADITLSAPLTKTIHNCETPWTNVSTNTNPDGTTAFKQGTMSRTFTVPVAFTTGKAFYIDLGSIQDFSTYSAVSFWMRHTTGSNFLATASMSVKLCSDTTGDVVVDSFPLTNITSQYGGSTGLLNWMNFRIAKDGGGTLGSNIRSVAIYIDSDYSTVSTQSFNFDNLIACNDFCPNTLIKIGPPRTKWLPSTAKVLDNEIVCNAAYDNGDSFLYYKCVSAGTTSSTQPDWPVVIGEQVTDGTVVWECMGEDEAWWPIQSIDGTALRVDCGGTATLPTFAQQGYYGRANGTYALWAREAIPLTPVNAASTTIFAFTEANRAADDLSVRGRTVGGVNPATGLVDGETYFDARNGFGNMFVDSGTVGYRKTVENIGTVRCGWGFQPYVSSFRVVYKLLDGVGNTTSTMYYNGNMNGFRDSDIFGIRATSCLGNNFNVRFGQNTRVKGLISINGGSMILVATDRADYIKGIYARNGYNAGFALSTGAYRFRCSPYKYIYCTGTRPAVADVVFGSIDEPYVFENGLFAGSVMHTGMIATSDTSIFSKNHDQIEGNHQIFWHGGNAQYIYDGSFKHGSSTGSWRLNPILTVRNSGFPLRLMPDNFLIRCRANVPVTISLWYYKDHANINGKIYIPAHQLKGMPNTITSSITSVVGAWTQISATFTPTETGICQWQWHTWDGITTDKNLYIADFSQSY